MTAFAAIKRKVIPPRVVKLSPEGFEPNWSGRPAVDIALGLRPLSLKELKECRVEAKREATGFYEEQPRAAGSEPFVLDVGAEIYNEVLLCEALARALCNPNNINQPYFEQATITIRSALTSEALQWLWEQYTVMTRGLLSQMAEAVDEELILLGRCLRSELGRRVLKTEGRKLAAYLLSSIRDAMPDTPDLNMIDMDNDLLDMEGVDFLEALDEDDEAETVHVARAQ